MLDRLVVGEIATKHHTALYGAAGELRYEECLTRQGFDGPYTILYHQRRPHELTSLRRVAPQELQLISDDHALKRQHYRTRELPQLGTLRISLGQAQSSSTVGTLLVNSGVPLLFNEDLVISVVAPEVSETAYVSNADGDELFFIHEGSGVLHSVFGELRFSAGDYLCVPRGVLRRFEIESGVRQHWLLVECRGGVGLLKHARNEVGQLRMDAPYSHRDFRRPQFVGPRDEGIRHRVVKRAAEYHIFSEPHSPLDVVGFDGSVYPWAFPISKFQPRVSSVHLPPTWHGTFQARGALICSFVPRPLDFGAGAVTCPYPHSSVDVDEVIYYASETFSSRKGIEAGSLTLHPHGIPHGPHPGAYESSIGATRSDECAVMLDCFANVRTAPAARQIEDSGYDQSFRA